MKSIELGQDLLPKNTKNIIAAKQKPQGLKENIKVAHKGGNIAKVAREGIEKELGESVVTKNNKPNYEYIETKNQRQKITNN